MLSRSKLEGSAGGGGASATGYVQQLVFPPSLLPASRTCDNLLHRISDIFELPEPQPPHEPPAPAVGVGAIVRLVRDDGKDGTLLRCAPSSSSAPDVFTVPAP